MFTAPPRLPVAAAPPPQGCYEYDLPVELVRWHESEWRTWCELNDQAAELVEEAL